MGIKDRLLEFVAYTKLSKRKFQERIGVSNSYIQNISEGIGADVLNRITIQFPELNNVWLLTGEGSMLKTDQELSSSSESETITVSREAWDIIKRQAESLERKDAQISDLISILKKINVQQDAPAACADAN